MHDGYSLAKTESGSPAPGEHARPEEPQDEYIDMPFTDLKRKVDTGCMHALSRTGQPARILRFQIDCSDAAARSLGLRNFLLAGPGAPTS
jgi:hypothetical protein